MAEAAKTGTKYGELRTEKQYLKKLTADVVSRFGDSLDMIAFAWMVYALTGSASLSAMTIAVNTLVSVLLSPFSAALITSFSKKLVIVTCDIGRGALVTLTAVLYLTGILQPWIIIVITGLNSTLESFRNPAGTAIFPHIISREKYTLGMSLSGALSRTAELIGTGLAGVLINFIGVSGLLFIDAGTFLFSAIVLGTLRLPEHVKEAGQRIVSEFVRNTKDGFKYAKGNSVALAVCVIACLINFAMTPLSALQAAYVDSSLRLGPEALSVIGVAVAVGMGLGAFFVPKLLAHTSRFRLLLVGYVLVCLSFLSLAFLPGIQGALIWAALAAALFILGIGVGLMNTVVQIAFVDHVEQDYLARMSGIISSGTMAAMPVASLLSAALARFMDVTAIFLIFGIFSVAVTLVMLMVKTLRRL